MHERRQPANENEGRAAIAARRIGVTTLNQRRTRVCRRCLISSFGVVPFSNNAGNGNVIDDGTEIE
jgi:hypothetical protein